MTKHDERQGNGANGGQGRGSISPDCPRVAIARAHADYAKAPELIRQALELLGCPAANPLQELVRPGDTVLLKPNLIRQSHAHRPDEWEQVVTHGAVIGAVAHLAADALQGSGRIVIADGPQTDSDFDQITTRVGLPEIVESLRRRGVDATFLDLRRDRWLQEGEVTYKRVQLPGDPSGYTKVDLGADSEFASYSLSGQFYGADYDTRETARFHSNGHHEYILCRTVMDADVVINLPKLKTHKKTGVTLSLKNMVGVNGYRNCLPHYTLGTPGTGGDEFSANAPALRFQSGMIRSFKRALTLAGGSGGRWARWVKRAGRDVFGDSDSVIRAGNWHGNDTAWRMVTDLNKCLFYYQGNGQRRTRPLRYLSIVDGIVAGEGNGPMAPDAVPAGLIVAGWNPVAVDTVCTELMGFDHEALPLTAATWGIQHLPLAPFGRESVVTASNVERWNGTLAELRTADHLGFQPHFGWRSKIERDRPQAPAAHFAGALQR